MGQIPLLDELAVICALGVLVTLLLARLRLPTVAGLLSAGALAGPFGLGWVRSVHSIEILAEIGVVLLLFTIGLEFSLSRLKTIFKQVALGGAIQVGLTAGVTTGVAVALGRPVGEGIFYGFVFALSSTAIVLRALGERRELDAPHGKFIVGTLIFQDLCVVPMVLVVPLLAPGAGGTAAELATMLGLALGKATAVVVGVLIVSRFVVPRLLAVVDASRSREVFLLTVLGLCIGTAWLTSLAGLSLALGAFLGGMVVADTEYGHRAMGDMLPLRDAFVSVFFVSLGMLFDARVVLETPLLFALLAVGFLGVKGLLATIAAVAMRFPPRVAWLAGVGLAQFGEFGFVLARLGQSAGVVDGEALRPVLAAGIASMFLTPLLVRAAPHFTAGEKILAPLTRLLASRSIDEGEPEAERESLTHGHVVIVGYGVAGRLVAQALDGCGVRYVVLELNADTVRASRAKGVPIHYADATSAEALEHAHFPHAQALVMLMNDPEAARRVVDVARRLAPDVPVMMRARYVLERDALRALGAADVVAEEVEGGVEMLARLLRRLEVPRNVIDEQIQSVREGLQPTERQETVPRRTLSENHDLAGLKIESVLVGEASRVVGKTLVQLELRKRTGGLVIALRRDGKLLEHPDPNDPLAPGDVAYVVGGKAAVDAAVELMAARA